MKFKVTVEPTHNGQTLVSTFEHGIETEAEMMNLMLRRLHIARNDDMLFQVGNILIPGKYVLSVFAEEIR
jgi:hypothetical protein